MEVARYQAMWTWCRCSESSTETLLDLLEVDLLRQWTPLQEFLHICRHKLTVASTSLSEKNISRSVHNSVFGAHLGTSKTTDKLLQRHYWYNKRDDVKVLVKQCDICAANKPPLKKFIAPLGDMRTGAPLDRLGIDIMDPLPLSHRGNSIYKW